MKEYARADTLAESEPRFGAFYRIAMVTSTFAHPYTTQVVALWLSFLPAAGIIGVMLGAIARGDRGFRRPIHINIKPLS